MNKDVAITYLKAINKGKNTDRIITRLYYGNEGKYVQDFSYFVDKNLMSDELMDALKYGQTLTEELENELDMFTIHGKI